MPDGNLYTVRNFDQGIIDTLRCTEGEFVDKDGIRKKQYFMTVDGLKTTSGADEARKVPVFFVTPTQAQIFPLYKVPAVVVRRANVAIALNRWFIPSWMYRESVEVNGDRYVEMQETYQPVDLQYTIQGIARYQADANVLLQHLLRIFKYPWTAVYVKDSTGRSYSFNAHLGEISSISDLIDVAEKLLGFSLSLTVWGELPVTSPVRVRAVEDVNITVNELE